MIVDFFIKIYKYFEKILHLLPRKKYLINNKLHKKYCYKSTSKYLKKCYEDKKIITISPCGFYGFYTLGVCMYIQKHYDTSEYIFSGSSAGAWNSLIMTIKDKTKLDKCKHIFDSELYKNKMARQILTEIKNNMLEHYTTDDFDLNRLYIGVTTIDKTRIYTGFETLEDALNCCVSSSTIPFITGSIFNKYKNLRTYDGIFSKNPYLNTGNVTLHITPNIWGQNEKIKFNLFKKLNFNDLYENGYTDTEKYGKETLDNLFKPLEKCELK